MFSSRCSGTLRTCNMPGVVGVSCNHLRSNDMKHVKHSVNNFERSFKNFKLFFKVLYGGGLFM